MPQLYSLFFLSHTFTCACSINCRICGAGIAPAWRSISRPFSNNAIVGIAVTRKRCPSVGTSSVHFSDDQAARSFLRHHAHLRRHHSARSAPWRPKIYQHGHSRSSGECVEGQIASHLDWLRRRVKFGLAFATPESLLQRFIFQAVALAALGTIH
jgi:hypothetical protein